MLCGVVIVINRGNIHSLLLISLLMATIILFINSGAYFVEANSIEPEVSDTAQKDSGLVPLVWTVLFVGGTIGLTLSYVSWRKYKGEVKKQAKKDNMVD